MDVSTFHPQPHRVNTHLPCPMCRNPGNGFPNIQSLCDRVLEMTTLVVKCPICPHVASNLQALAGHLIQKHYRLQPQQLATQELGNNEFQVSNVSSFSGQNADYNGNTAANNRFTVGNSARNSVDNQNGMSDPSLVELENLLNDFSEIVDGNRKSEDKTQDVIMNSEVNVSGFKGPTSPSGSNVMPPNSPIETRNHIGSMSPSRILDQAMAAISIEPKIPETESGNRTVTQFHFQLPQHPLPMYNSHPSSSTGDDESSSTTMLNDVQPTLGAQVNPSPGSLDNSSRHQIKVESSVKNESSGDSSAHSAPAILKSHQCDLCGWNFDDANFLHLHRVLMHSHQSASDITPQAGVSDGDAGKAKFEKSFEVQKLALVRKAKKGQNKVGEHYNCRFCSERLAGFDAYTAHLRRVHEDHRHVCSTCGKLFKLRGSLLVHQRVVHNPSNSGVGSYPCGVCARKFTNKYRRDIHQRRHAEGDLRVTSSPSQSSSADRASSLQYQCTVCQQKFETQCALVLHSVSHMKQPLPLSTWAPSQNSPQSETPQPSPKTFECAQCDKTFQSDVALNQHMKTHNVTKQWECQTCHKTFTTKYFLKKHNRLHTGETPYKCNICGRAFTFQQSFHKHMLYHTDEKPYSCSQCGRAFKELSTLQNHERIHSGERPFECETCGKSFRQRVSYLVHRRIHTGVMPYSCNACGKHFRYKVTQRTHKCTGDPSLSSSNSFSKVPSPSQRKSGEQDERQMINSNLPSLPESLQQDLLRFRQDRRQNARVASDFPIWTAPTFGNE